MRHRTKIVSVLTAATLAISLLATPASALTPPGSVHCSGTMPVSTGMQAPGFGPSQAFTWELDTTCSAASPDGVETFALSLSGTGTGWCWLSDMSGGSATLSSGRQTINLSDPVWESAGGVFVFAGNHDAGGLGTFVGLMVVSGGSDCFGQGQTEFDVTIDLVFA